MVTLAPRLIHSPECIREGRPKLAHDAGQSALYSLRWSGVPYTTRPKEFSGFFEGEGNRTDIPNEFFDVVIPREPLSVIKVVGSIIRDSIGFQTKHGRRRQQVALSYQQIQNYARFGSRSDLAKALRIAQERNYIIWLEEGVFSPFGSERKRATYAVRWSDLLIGRKNEPAENRSENQTSIGRISEPEDRSEIRTSIKTKPIKETGNKLAAGTEKALAILKEAGFTDRIAEELASSYPLETIERQIAWLAHRSAKRPQGMLRKAIENDWPEPAGVRMSELAGTAGFEFARHFYTAFGGNRGEPVNEPSPRDADMAGAFVKRLEAATGASAVTNWARALGKLAREQRNPFPSLQLAIRQLGDGLLVRMELDAKSARQSHAAARWIVHERGSVRHGSRGSLRRRNACAASSRTTSRASSKSATGSAAISPHHRVRGIARRSPRSTPPNPAAGLCASSSRCRTSARGTRLLTTILLTLTKHENHHRHQRQRRLRKEHHCHEPGLRSGALRAHALHGP